MRLIEVVIITFIVLMLTALILCTLPNIVDVLKYLNAPKIKGKITEVMGVEETYSYGRSSRIKYGKYLILINSMYGYEWQEALIKNTKLKAGDKVELRYKVEDEKVVLLNNVSYSHTLIYPIGSLIVLVLFIIALVS